MARVPYLDPSDLTAEHKDLLARNINLFRAMVHSPNRARAHRDLQARRMVGSSILLP